MFKLFELNSYPKRAVFRLLFQLIPKITPDRFKFNVITIRKWNPNEIHDLKH